MRQLHGEKKVAKETFEELGTSIQQRCHVQRLVDVMASVCICRLMQSRL